MIVVADAGPIIHLSRIQRIDLLPALYRRLLIPISVYNEIVQAGRGLIGFSWDRGESALPGFSPAPWQSP